MTDKEKTARLDRILHAKYPDIKESEYEEFRDHWIRKREKLKLWLILGGTLVLLGGAALSKVSMAAFWCVVISGFAISMTGAALGQYLPAVKPKKVADVPEEFLTADRIARDCAKGKKGSIGWFFLFFTLAVAVCGIPANGLEGILNLWWLFGPLAALCIFFIIRAQIKGRKLEAELQQGDFHLICSPLIDKEEEEDSTGDTTTYEWYLYFNCHDEHGRYKLKTSQNQFAIAESGKDFYVVLRKNRKGIMEAVNAYRAEKNPLDAQLKEMLKRDAALTGKPLTMEEELENAKARLAAHKEKIQLSPEEAEAMQPTINSWSQRAMTLLWIAVAVTIVCIVLSVIMMFRINALENSSSWLSEPRDVAWYWKLLLTMVYFAGCGLPFWRHFRYIKQINAYQERMLILNNSRYGCLRVFLLCFVWFGSFAMSILLLCIWRVLT
ncbi:MAG: hypothetical protein E7324_00220 [Clostridiales bacterium]|nr:hypothetical protein [Clostridiales bacterium]